MVAAATLFADDFADGAVAHDRDGTFAIEHLEKLRADGFLVAPVPAEFGGGGVTSIHDVLVASSRLARGDPPRRSASTCTSPCWSTSCARGASPSPAARCDVARRRRCARQACARSWRVDVVFAAAASEPSPQDLTRPSTTATRVGDGWVVNGRKMFATMAPAATILNVAVTLRRRRGPGALRVRPGAGRAARASCSTTTGTPSACGRRRPDRCRSRTSASAPTACATGSRPGQYSAALSRPLPRVRGAPRRGLARDRRGGPRRRPHGAAPSRRQRRSPTRTLSPSWRPTSSTWRRCGRRSTGPGT